MLSREETGEPLDFRLLREALARLEPDLEVRVDARRQQPGLSGRVRFAFGLLAQLRLAATARVVVVDTYSPVVSLIGWRGRVRVIQIWHALGALKQFGWDSAGRPGGRPLALARAMRMHRGYDLVLASSERCRRPYASAFRVPPERIDVAPLPRVDLLLDSSLREATRQRILAAFPQLGEAEVVVYAPTFRASKAADVAALASAVSRHGKTLVHAPHPLSFKGEEVFVAEGFTTAELLGVASAFVTDYSSAVFEAALAGIPCYFYAPDLEEYEAERGLYLDLAAELPGSVHTDPGALAEAIAAGQISPGAARAFAARWIALPELGSTQGGHGFANSLAAIVRRSLSRAEAKRGEAPGNGLPS
jgi:CDP-glycerol glycerophosphotransferase (TagB/SpsB family)